MDQQIIIPNLINQPESMTGDLNRDIQDPAQRITAPAEPSKLSPQVMSNLALADQCMHAIDNYRRGEPSNDQYGLELFRRALMQHDPSAWEIIQQRFNDTMLHWMRSHPLRETACHFDSDENYVAQAFTRFWQATVGNQKIEFRTLAAVLRYLRASLNGTILDTLRACSRPREIPLPEPGEPGEPIAEDQDDGRELWEVFQRLLSDKRQQRVAYLIFHCGLKPREIVRFCAQEFIDVEEVYRLRRNIFERLVRNADYIYLRFNH